MSPITVEEEEVASRTEQESPRRDEKWRWWQIILWLLVLGAMLYLFMNYAPPR